MKILDSKAKNLVISASAGSGKTFILIEKIKQFRYIIAFKGGPSEYGNDSYIIDEISDQKKCNSLCDDIWDAYTNLLDVWHNLQDS